MVPRRVAILLTLFIFGMIARAWCDPVKSLKGAAVQLTTVKIDESKAFLLKKIAPAKESAEWSKKGQAGIRDVNFLRTLEERKRSQWVESSDKVITSREFSENTWRDRFFGPRQSRENKSSGPDGAQPVLKPSPDGNGRFEQERILTTLRLLQSKEEILKEIFMGFHFSFDLTDGRMFFEMNVAPSSEKRSGFMIRF